MALAWLASSSFAVKPVRLIIDTDIGGGACMDVDDVAAVCLANALADSGKAELLAVVQNTQPPACAGVVSVLNSYHGRGDVPIGAYKGSGLTHSGQLSYVADLAANFSSPVKNSSQVPDAVAVYRRVLAASPPHSVVISSIGLMTNLELLLRSKPDKHSELSGEALVASRVALLVAMAGSYPGGAVDSGAGGSMKECNMCGCYNNADPTSMATAGAASAFVYSHWPPSVRLVFSGVEVGVRVRSGAVLEACAPADSPCRRAFLDYKRDNPSGWAAGGRCSWDPLTTLVGVLGASAERTGVEECTDCDGTNQVDSDGSNRWVAGPPSNQSYLVLKNATAARPVHSVGLGVALPGQGAAEELNGSAKRCVAQAAGEAIDALLCQRPSASRGQRRSVEER